MSETRWKLFNRFALLEFDIKNEQKILSLTSEDIDFNARVSLNRFSNNNTANITLYNLPKNIRNKLIKNIEVRINAGYLTLESENIKDNIDNNINDFGITFLGVIENVKDSCDNTTIKTEIQCSEVNYDYKENKITGTYYKDTPAIEILKDIQKKSSLFFDFDKINLGIPDFKYERGKILGNNLNNIFYRIAADTNSYFYLHNNSVIFTPREEPALYTITGNPYKIIDFNKTKDGYNISMFFDHRMKVGCLFDIKHNSNDKIEIFSHFISKVEHEINTKNGAQITKIEVVDIQFAKEKLKEDDKTKASQNNKPLNKQK